VSAPVEPVGVPVELVTHYDYIVVRASLIRLVGGATEAIVWARINFRCQVQSLTAYEWDDGERWWPASFAVIAEETGLSPKQCRTATDHLVRDGFLLAEKHHLRSAYDQTLSYRPVIRGNTDVPVRAGGVQEGNSDVPQGADVPLFEELQEVTVSVGFAEFYMAYPRKVGKEAARRAFEKATKDVVPAVLVDAARRYASDPNLPDKQFIPHPATWLSRGSWEDEPLPPRVSSSGPASAPRADDFADGDEWQAYNR